MRGLDAAREIGSLAPRLQAAGLGFVSRYYSYSQAKNLSASEARALSASGIQIVSVWEARGDLYASFNPAQGARDAVAAIRLAESVGQPDGTGIYFAVDFDASPSQVAGGISAYFTAVQATIAKRFRIGVYGSGLVCDSLRLAGLAELYWLACASDWRGTGGFAGWHIRQGLPSDPYRLGFQVDLDDAIDGDFGQWSLAAPKPVAPEDSPVEHIRMAQRLVGVTADGDPGPQTRAAVTAWRNAHPSA